MFRTLLGLLLLAGLPWGPAYAASTAAADTVTRFHQQLAESMRLPACEARLAKLAPAVDGSFDLPFIAERALRASVEYAFEHPDASRDFVRANAQEMSADVCRQHIELYVNDFTLDLGDEGALAIDELLGAARA